MMKASEVRLLVVDDEESLRDTIRDIFQLFGFKVDVAENGEVAWQKLEQHPYDIILTDLRMPVLDGLGLMQRLQQKPEPQNILVTSGFPDSSLETLQHLGAMGFLPKPISASVVRDVISRSLLRVADRWAQRPAEAGSTPPLMQRKFTSMNKAITDRQIEWGRGGFFLAHHGHMPPIGSLVRFELQINDLNPVRKIEGLGWLRWAHEEEEHAGLGLEIAFLEDDCREKVCAWLTQQNLRRFIPSPRLSH